MKTEIFSKAIYYRNMIKFLYFLNETVSVPEKRKSVDLLVEEFWRKGYLTLRRRFGTYLPEPSKVGDFDVDIIARLGKKYAIGITLTSEDLNNPDLPGKITYLASRQTKYTSIKVLLFIGVPLDNLMEARELVKNLSKDISSNIRIVPITEKK